jgi:L-ascorbate metabolism protein UlaG (beta-lactamase superfamily)
MLLLPAFQKDDVLLADIAAASRDVDQCHLWWLGQSGFLVQWAGHHLLFDPYLSDALTEKYAATNKPHVRVSERTVDPARLDMVDVVTASHNHTDHLDAATLRPLAQANPALVLVMPRANLAFAEARLGAAVADVRGLDDDGVRVEAGPFSFTGVAAAHNGIDRDATGACHYLGFIVRFGPFCLYHSGDTLWHEGLVPALTAAQPDVVLVPINGNDPARGVAGNLDGREAAELARACGARLAIPHHFDMFAFNTAAPDLFVETCRALGQPQRVLRGGERLTLDARP